MNDAAVTYPVNEIFASIQGEGSHTGVASIFVRLQGCDVGCPWCDTKHTWERDPAMRVEHSIIQTKTEKAEPTFGVYTAEELVEAIKRTMNRRSIKHVVITGGEPAMHELRPLIRSCRVLGWTVQLETSGTYNVPLSLDYFMTLSPKLMMPGGKVVKPSAWMRADEVKLPVGKMADVERFLQAAEPWLDSFKGKRIYLQPLSQNKTATALCTDVALERGWAVSIQTHKYLGLR